MKAKRNNFFIVGIGILLCLNAILIYSITMMYSQSNHHIHQFENKQLSLKALESQINNMNKIKPIYDKLNHYHVIYIDSLKSNFYQVLEQSIHQHFINLKQVNVSVLTPPKDKNASLSFMTYEINAYALHEEHILEWLEKIRNLHTEYIFDIEQVKIQRLTTSDSTSHGNLELKCIIKLYTYYVPVKSVRSL